MTLGRPHHLGLLSGVIFIALVIVAFVVLAGSTPDLKDSAQRIATFYSQHSSREKAASFVLAIAALFGAIFVAHLWATLRWAGSPSAWTALVLIAGAVAVTGFLVEAAAHLALTEAADKGFAPDGLRVLNAIDSDFFFPMGGGMALLLIGSGAALRERALVPRWLAWVAIVIGVVAFSPVGFFAFLLSGVWVLILSVLLSRRLAADRHATP